MLASLVINIDTVENYFSPRVSLEISFLLLHIMITFDMEIRGAIQVQNTYQQLVTTVRGEYLIQISWPIRWDTGDETDKSKRKDIPILYVYLFNFSSRKASNDLADYANPV